MGPTARIMSCGKRLHLQHGPIDLIIGADGDRHGAFSAAKERFETILEDLVSELPVLRLPLSDDVPAPQNATALRMDHAVRKFMYGTYVTRMAAVAGSVADTVLEAMKPTDISRAYVNNGGDIALYQTAGTSFTMAMAAHNGENLGQITIEHNDSIRGVATSGRHGRSHSLGIADSVTVLAENAATADVAATLIANGVTLPKHSKVTHMPASVLDENSDLGDLPVVTEVGRLTLNEVAQALQAGRVQAETYIHQNLISGAALFLQDQSETTCPAQLSITQRTPPYA